MQGPAADETVGSHFTLEKLHAARQATLAVIEEAARSVKVGSTESEAKTKITQLLEQAGAPKSWHPPQIRFGQNTVQPFGGKGVENVALAENDIFFFDLGPILDGHEGDVGRTFTLGHDPEMARCRDDVATIWREVRDHWSEGAVTGKELYDFAALKARSRGWILSLDHANGHRIADFPHAARARGSIEGFSGNPVPSRWVLEIQIRHPTRGFGAFYEDLLE